MAQGWIALKGGEVVYARQTSHRDNWVRRLDGGGQGAHEVLPGWTKDEAGWLQMMASREEAQALVNESAAKHRAELFRSRAFTLSRDAERTKELSEVALSRATAADRRAGLALEAAGAELARVDAIMRGPGAWQEKLKKLEEEE